MDLLLPNKSESKPFDEKKLAKVGSKNQLILGSESAYELGSHDKNSISFLCVSDNDSICTSDEVVVIGNDLDKINANSNYARITLVQTVSLEDKTEQQIFNSIKAIELKKYDFAINGFMMRASGLNGREQIRVSKKELKKGLSFFEIGNRFISQYKKNKQIKNIKIIFVTLDDFDYASLETISLSVATRTKALDHMVKDLKMDCNSCEWKVVCDEVDGMKQAHERILNTINKNSNK